MTVRAGDNWLQRRYFAWAAPHYARMPPRTRADVERIDRWLYSRRGAVVWLGLAAAIAATAAAIHAAGMPLGLALVFAFSVWIGLPFGVLGAWLQPERFAGRRLLRVAIFTTVGLYVGTALGFLSGRVARLGSLGVDTLAASARRAFVDVMPLLVLAGVVLIGVLMLTALARRQLLKVELERSRLVQERDAAARQAAESRLHLLQAQIRPHFIFNTLASLQHWVDGKDERAGPLLRSLTALLRQTTDSLDAPVQTVERECATAANYLQILAARLGARLSWRVDVDPACAGVVLPAGLVLTLVENAVEHGIEPAIRGGTIVVRVQREDGRVVVAVADDGVGLAPLAAGDERGIGVANCRERLRHLHGEAATLELASGADGRGCVARAVFPAPGASPAPA